MPDRPLSFAMLTTFYPPYHFGGDAMYIYRLSNELARRGHRVVVAHCTDAYRLLGGKPAGAFPHHPNVEVVPLASRFGALSPLTTYLTGQPGFKAPALEALLSRERFDVIHFHNVSLIGGPGILHYGSAIKLYTMHEHWLVCPMHVLWKDNREPCVTPECLKCTLAFHRPPQLWRYTGLLERELGHVDMFLSPSRFTEAQHRQRGFPDSLPIRVLPYFLPQPTTDNEVAPDLPTKRPYFLFVGRLEKLKGLQTLIERFRQYRAADLLVAGDGEYGAELRLQSKDLDHVHFLGRVHPAQLGALYANATAVIVPSVGYETFGIVSLEAFARRTPVIVRDLGGLPECVRDSGGGFTYSTDEELTRAMSTLQHNPELRRDLGERGYRGYLDRWSEEPHMTTYFEAIEEARGRHLARTQEAAWRSRS